MRNANLQRAGESFSDADILYPGYRAAETAAPFDMKAHLDQIHRKRAQELAAMSQDR